MNKNKLNELDEFRNMGIYGMARFIEWLKSEIQIGDTFYIHPGYFLNCYNYKQSIPPVPMRVTWIGENTCTLTKENGTHVSPGYNTLALFVKRYGCKMKNLK